MNCQIDTSLLDSFPFKAHINSNYVPTDDETREIEAFLVQPAIEIQAMRQERMRLEQELEAIKTKHDNVLCQYRACAALITPFRRLPDDILREIFFACLPKRLNAAMSNKTAPLIFTLVCRHWREVVLSTPRMWSTIHLHVIQKPQKQLAIDIIGRNQGGGVTVIKDWDKYRANKVSEWLQLSGTLPISISIVRGVNSAGVLAPRASIETQLAAVVPFASRCRNLFFQGPPDSLSRLAAINAPDLSSLESLFLHAPFEGQGNRPLTNLNDMDTWQHSGLLAAPLLRKLSLRHRNINFALLNVHWFQLTHLDLGGSYQGVNPHLLHVSAAKLSGVLQRCERLVCLKLDLEVADDIHNTNIPAMPLLCLRNLSIRTPSDLAPIIEKLEIPAVKELTFHSTAKNANHPQCLMMLVQAGAIAKLDLDARNVPHASFLQCLRQCRALFSLTLRCARNSMERSRTPGDLIHSSRVDDEFLDLISTSGTDAFCPLLDEFICDYLTEFTTVGLTEFITRKQGGNIPGLARLRTLTLLNVPLHKRREIQQWASSLQIRAYVDAGLAVQLDSHNEDKSYQPTEEEDRYSIIDFGRSSMQYAGSWMQD